MNPYLVQVESNTGREMLIVRAELPVEAVMQAEKKFRDIQGHTGVAVRVESYSRIVPKTFWDYDARVRAGYEPRKTGV